MDEAQVDQIRAGVMRRADSPADLTDTPSGEIQADEKGLGEQALRSGQSKKRSVALAGRRPVRRACVAQLGASPS